jgi:hypothetical protein
MPTSYAKSFVATSEKVVWANGAHIVKGKYRQAADRCRFLDLPTPRVMQEPVTTWKVLWRWRK